MATMQTNLHKMINKCSLSITKLAQPQLHWLHGCVLPETPFITLTLKYLTFMNHLEIRAMVTRHLSVKRYLWSAGRLTLEAQVMVALDLKCLLLGCS